MAVNHPKVRFEDGEGLTHGDLIKSEVFVQDRVLELATHLSGAMLGNVHNMGEANATGMDPLLDGGLNASALDTTKLYCPNMMAGFVEHSGSDPTAPDGTITIGNCTLVQARSGSTPGTAPDGVKASDTLLVAQLANAEYDLGAQLTTNPAPGAGNPRWDTVGIRLGYGTGGSESRDFEDAVTGAKSTSSLDKEYQTTVEFEFVVGNQDTQYQQATLSAGYVPFLTIKREVGESTPYDRDNFFLEVYPMRYSPETVWGRDMVPFHDYVDGESQGWRPNQLNGGMAWVGADLDSDLIATPKYHDQFSRLVGVCYMRNFTSAFNRSQFINHKISPTHVTTDTFIANAESALTNAVNGLYGVSEADWNSGSSKSGPIWGNGTSYGPLFSMLRQDLDALQTSTTDYAEFEILGLRFDKAPANVFTAGDEVILAKFYFLR